MVDGCNWSGQRQRKNYTVEGKQGIEFSTLSRQFKFNFVLKCRQSQGIALWKMTFSSCSKQLSAAKDEKQVFGKCFFDHSAAVIISIV